MSCFVWAGILLILLLLAIFWFEGNRKIIEEDWPYDLSLETKIEVWYLYSVAGVEYYRVKRSSKLLHDDAWFFIEGNRVPFDCSKTNPVILTVDYTSGYEKIIVMSESFFNGNYKKYKAFNSFKEYEDYMRSTK
jgi:hypothetical protein